MVGSRWVTAPCPLAPFTHSKGRDARPSFGVNVETGMFNCFVCQSGSLAKLVQLLEMYSAGDEAAAARYDTAAARAALDGLDDGSDALPGYEYERRSERSFEAWPEYFLSRFVSWRDSPRASWYLSDGRQLAGSQPVDPQVADTVGLLYDAKWDRVVCPYRTYAGALAGARGRTIDPTATLQHFDYTSGGVNNAHLVWYNERALESAEGAREPVLVVEGQFDAMNVLRAYPHVVACLTTKPSRAKLEKLQSCGAVVTMLDNDGPGRQALAKYEAGLSGRTRLGRLEYPEEYKDPAKVPLDLLRELLEPLRQFDKLVD